MVAQLSGHNNLREIIDNMMAQKHRLYHLGSAKLTRQTLSHINEGKPYHLYESLFGRLLSRCQAAVPKHNFRFKYSVYALDATTIDLCLSAFTWAEFRSAKGAIKLHVGLNHQGYLPESITVTDGKNQYITAARKMNLPQGSIVIVDKRYNYYAWYKQLIDDDMSFFTRLKSNAKYRVIARRESPSSKGITSDQVIEFTGTVTSKNVLPAYAISVIEMTRQANTMCA